MTVLVFQILTKLHFNFIFQIVNLLKSNNFEASLDNVILITF